MQAVVMAGGLGTRLRPVTLKIPKPMVLVNGRPFIEHQILLLKKNGIRDFLLCVGYLADRFVEHFGDGKKLGVNVRYSVECEPLGTGGALKNAEKMLEEDFLYVNGDTYLPIDYKKLVEFYMEKKKKGVIVLYDNRVKIAENNISLGGDGLVAGYSKKSAAGMDYVDAGVCLFNRSVLSLIPEGNAVSLEMETFPRLIEQKQLAGFVTSQWFYDMGTPERLREIEGVLR
jgi:mannose-1-phosphate guanylyltransferase